MSPRVTVLLAVHNGEPFVREAVVGVLDQTFGDFELLIVDDASTDGTAAVVESFGDTRIRLIRNEHNLGQAPSLNLGLREARGAIVSRLDADDRMLPELVSSQVAALDANPRAALAGAWMRIVDEDGRPYATQRGSIRTFAQFVYAILVDRYPWGHPSIAYRRDVVRELGGYDAQLAPAEDKDLYRRLALAGHGAVSIDKPLVLYRTHRGQLSQERRAIQLANDHVGQERFITALDPRAPARALRLLLAVDPEFWSENDVPATIASLDRLLAELQPRLALDAGAANELRHLLAFRLVEAAQAQPWRRGSRTLAYYGLNRLPADRRKRASAGLAAAFVLQPAAWGLRLAARGAAVAVDRVPPLRALRGPAGRSRMARLLYAKLVGSG